MAPEPRDLGKIIESELLKLGIFKPSTEHQPTLHDGNITSGYGYPITGLEKFLGYFDETINIANFPSISIVTDFSIARAECRYIKQSGKDSVLLDGKASEKYQQKAVRALQFFKSLYGISGSFQFYVERKKKYKNAKGLGESASVAAAVSRALISNVFGPEGLNDVTLTSRFARMVSGSGTRSVSGGLSLWLSYPYIEESHSAGYFIKDPGEEMHVGAFPMPSEIVTDSAHRLAESSDFYGRWVSSKYQHLLEEIEDGFDIEHLMKRAQEDMYTLNSIILSRGHFIQTPASLTLINSLNEFRKKHEGLYYTADTGPTIVLMSRDRKLIEEFVGTRKEEFIWSSRKITDPGENRDFKSRASEFLQK